VGICLIVGDNCWKRQLIPHTLESRKEKQERRGTEGKFLVFLFSDWVKERFLKAFSFSSREKLGKGVNSFWISPVAREVLETFLHCFFFLLSRKDLSLSDEPASD
jgi:hypothetical protein